MTAEEMRTEIAALVAEARTRFRTEAAAVCRTEEEAQKAASLESAIGEISPDEAIDGLKRWISAQHERND